MEDYTNYINCDAGDKDDFIVESGPACLSPAILVVDLRPVLAPVGPSSTAGSAKPSLSTCHSPACLPASYTLPTNKQLVHWTIRLSDILIGFAKNWKSVWRILRMGGVTAVLVKLSTDSQSIPTDKIFSSGFQPSNTLFCSTTYFPEL